ncbi:MAG TPA: polyprenyl diphosphate synthase [Chlamydiales bacterium]|jgi:undecaprenyl diphosphate synthase|nr:polyprenyl diphosphate synthase [Chlamydiales bacterium]
MTTVLQQPASEFQLREIPRHIAIIMDGNRRWAKRRGIPPSAGHWEGAETLAEIVRAAADIGIKTLTVYSFSTENWSRADEEIEVLMNLFEIYLTKKRDSLVKDGVRLDAIGDLEAMPEKVKAALDLTRKATEQCDKINLVLAINYGGRDEIRRAVRKIVEKGIKAIDITEELISSELDTHRYGDPELLIRTSGELRISNFLIWQISYTEIYTTDVLWPDFTPVKLYEAVHEYQSRIRRKGT